MGDAHGQSAREMLGHVALRVRLVYGRLADKGRADRTSNPAAAWDLVAILPEEQDDAETASAHDSTHGSSAHESTRFVTEPVELTLDRDEAEGYYLNLTAVEPSFFALLRETSAGQRPDAVAVTASYTESARWMDGGMVVLRCPLPAALLAWIAEFAQHHYAPEGRKKRAGPRPSFLSRAEFGEQSRAALARLRPERRSPEESNS